MFTKIIIICNQIFNYIDRLFPKEKEFLSLTQLNPDFNNQDDNSPLKTNSAGPFSQIWVKPLPDFSKETLRLPPLALM